MLENRYKVSYDSFMLLNPQKKGVIMMVFSAVFFSSKPILTKLAYKYGVTPEALLGMRMMIAVPLFWVFLGITTANDKGTPVTKKDVLFFILTGFVGFFLAAETGFSSLKYIDASVSTMIIYTYPSIVTILSYFILKERISLKKVSALVMVFLGTIAVLNVFDLSGKEISTLGALLSFLAAFFFSIYYIMCRLLSKDISSIRLTTYLITAGGTFVILYWHGTDLIQPVEVWLYAFGLATLGTLFPFLLLGEGVKLIGASNAAIFSAIGPVSTITLSYLVLGERLDPLQLLGASLIIAGIVTLGRRNREKEGALPA
jgi:drug/metabolite transporter (DMT)-like permease